MPRKHTVQPYERGFVLDPKKGDELQDFFEDLVGDGGLLAVRDILAILAEATMFTAEIAVDEMLEEGREDPRLRSWARSLEEVAGKILGFSRKKLLGYEHLVR